MDMWSETILQVLPGTGRPLTRADIEVLCTQKLDMRLDPEAFRKSLAKLAKLRLVSEDARSVWRVEPDFEERAIEDGVQAFLESAECLASLSVVEGSYVFQKTTTVGPTGAGRWSRPDFALAAVRRFRYDPRRYLDVFSFELKNRGGTTLLAVHETLAHARFSHYSYLVCPRSNLDPSETNKIRQACADHEIGLITFELRANEEEMADTLGFRFDAMPRRRSPDPAEIDEHLDARLSEHNQRRLLGIAGQL